MPKLTETAGNPAHDLRQDYPTLMGIDCVIALKERLLGLVKPGKGISSANFRKFKSTVERIEDVARLKGYVTNFMLKADGLGVI